MIGAQVTMAKSAAAPRLRSDVEEDRLYRSDWLRVDSPNEIAWQVLSFWRASC